MKLAQKILKKWRKIDKGLLVLLVIFTFEFTFPHLALAGALSDESAISYDSLYSEIENNLPQKNFLPQAGDVEYKKIIYVTVTAYSSTEDQTDSSPCITANGYDVCSKNNEDVVAANFLPFGAKVRFPYKFDKDRYFYVQDRMNERYPNRIDIWMKSRAAAKEFGIKRLRVEIY